LERDFFEHGSRLTPINGSILVHVADKACAYLGERVLWCNLGDVVQIRLLNAQKQHQVTLTLPIQLSYKEGEAHVVHTDGSKMARPRPHIQRQIVLYLNLGLE
jgi:hypothetical protein